MFPMALKYNKHEALGHWDLRTQVDQVDHDHDTCYNSPAVNSVLVPPKCMRVVHTKEGNKPPYNLLKWTSNFM